MNTSLQSHATGRRAGWAPRRGRRLGAVLASALALCCASPASSAQESSAPESPAPPAPASGARLTLSPPYAPDEGHAFAAAVPGAWRSDRPDHADSRAVLLEDGKALGPAHALHEDIRTLGGGRYSHWAGALLFSTSDNSDPNSNGRRYELEWRGASGLGEDGYQPFPLRDPFSQLPARDAAPAVPPIAADAPRVIWWYTIDALRADAPAASVNGVPVMPELSAFAREQAVAFDEAFATASFTKTSTASMFTGLWPQRHDVVHGVLPVWPDGSTLVFDLDRRFDTLASALVRRGFDTWTHPYSVHVRRGDGMLAGFLHTDLDPDAADPLPLPAGRLFVYEHVLGVHAPYRPSAAARERLGLAPAEQVDPGGTDWFERPLDDAVVAELHAAYLGEAADADAGFARRVAWLRAAGRWDDTLLIVTADHGEAFLEHGAVGHSTTLHAEMVHVPLFIKFPAGSPFAALHGRSFPQRVSLADLYPTLLELLGGPGPAYALDGRSLLPILDGRETDPLARDVLMRCSVTASRPDGAGSALFLGEAILCGPLKALFGFRCADSQDPARHPFRQGEWIAELYDVQSDPGELHDLSRDRPADFLRLLARAQEARAPLRPADGRPAAATDPADEDGRELLERLQQLGYVR